MNIEFLYPELTSQFGDGANRRILRHLFPDAQVFETPFPEEPRFLQEPISFVYFGAMEESDQDRIIARLLPLREKMNAAFEADTFLFCTGNAGEIFARQIEDPEKGNLPGLHLAPFSVQRDYAIRINAPVIGEVDPALLTEQNSTQLAPSKKLAPLGVGGVVGSYSRLQAESNLHPFLQHLRVEGEFSEIAKPTAAGFWQKNRISCGLLGPVLANNYGLLAFLAAQWNALVPDTPLFAAIRENEEMTHAELRNPSVVRIIQD